MSFLLAAQNAVSWQRRGIVTSGVQFFRTIGGSLGIGILGAVFNIIALPHLNGIGASLLDPHARAALDPAQLRSSGTAIDSGLHYVFIAMLGVSILQFIVARWMPVNQAAQALSAREAAEALVG